ncbi:hypothetical protein A0J48_025170 [Sphaerospermopsis aphanizomenoides BCCUSP55]|nr:hypothetical protein [Sphaerospermopsis aphanizomenoides BCCUSP55]
MNKKIIVLLFLIVSFLIFIALTSYFISWDVIVDLLYGNRNVTSLVDGDDGSLNERAYLYELGLQEVLTNLFFGNYTEIMKSRGSGNYIHNILGILQYFGLSSFLGYLSLIIFCIKRFFTSWRSIRNFENIIFNNIFVFSIFQIILFRFPLGFYPIFICFGMELNSLSGKFKVNTKEGMKKMIIN